MSAASLIAIVALLKTMIWVISSRSKRSSGTSRPTAYDEASFVPTPRSPSEHPTGSLITEEDSCAAGARMMYGDLRDPMEDEHTLLDKLDSPIEREWDA